MDLVIYQVVEGVMEADTGTKAQQEAQGRQAQAQVEERLVQAGATQAHLT